MTEKEVADRAGLPVNALDPPRPFATHLIRDGATDVWLVFDDGRLRSIQLAWMYALKKMKTDPRIDLCA